MPTFGKKSPAGRSTVKKAKKGPIKSARNGKAASTRRVAKAPSSRGR